MPDDLQQYAFLGMPAVIASPAMKRLVALVKRTARGSSSVLITGERGSGKEVVARAIHHFSLRCSRPWVDVRCPTLPAGLVESELFGCEKGAFGGAEVTRPGLLALADKGTLFLDEVAALSLKVQLKLLRVLEAGSYHRVGGHRKVSVDVRVTAATNQNLADAVHFRRFRRDLCRRLSEVHIHVPPLRERPEDITPLALFFLQESIRHTGCLQPPRKSCRAIRGRAM